MVGLYRTEAIPPGAAAGGAGVRIPPAARVGRGSGSARVLIACSTRVRWARAVGGAAEEGNPTV